MKLTKRTILITGGTSGIGLELARQLTKRGNQVAITGRDAGKLASVKRELPALVTFQSDVADADAVRKLSGMVAAALPSLDTLINNAGIMRNLRLDEPRGLEDLTSEVDVLLSGPMRMIGQFLPQLRSQAAPLIANISSGLAFVPMPASPIYSAAKAGLHAYTRSLRVQLADTNVRVVEVAPPPVETKLFRGEFAEEMAREKAMAPAELVRKALAGIEAGQDEIRPGVANVLKVASRVAPGFMFRQMAKLGRPKSKAA